MTSEVHPRNEVTPCISSVQFLTLLHLEARGMAPFYKMRPSRILVSISPPLKFQFT